MDHREKDSSDDSDSFVDVTVFVNVRANLLLLNTIVNYTLITCNYEHEFHNYTGRRLLE